MDMVVAEPQGPEPTPAIAREITWDVFVNLRFPVTFTTMIAKAVVPSW